MKAAHSEIHSMIPMWKNKKKLNSYVKNFPTGIGLTLYKGNFEKYKGKFVMSVFWVFRSFYALISCLMALVCIPEVQTHLLTPILPYLDMTNVRCRLCHLWQKCQKCHIWRKCHSTYAMSRYGNMGVKRSVRTSRIQINTIKQLVNGFNSLKLQNIDFANFPLYFSKFPLYNVRPFPVGKFFT